MAHTKVTKTYSQNTGTANTFSYSGSFDVFKGTEVVALLDNVLLTYTASTINESASPREYTVDTAAKTIHIGGANLSSGTVIIRPETDMGAPTPRADYSPGASITSADLNNNQLQLMRKAMEYGEQVLFNTGGVMTGDLGIGEDQTIYFEGATDNAYETTLTVTDPTADRTITLPDVTGTVVTTGDEATVTATMLAANSVDSSELVDGSIDSSHISSSAVTTGKIAADAVTGAKIADDAIDSEHYTDGSIDTAHIADDQITTAKIADDAITNAKMANNSVSNAELTDDAVNTAEIAAGAVTAAKIAADAVTGAKVADDAIDSEHYTDASIDHQHLSNDCIDGTNIQDDVINSEHYAAGSIDHEHLANDIIDGDNIQDDVINSEHIAAGAIDLEHMSSASVDSDNIVDDTIVNADINTGAAIAHSKLAAVSSGNVIVGNGSNVPTSVAMSGDVAIAAGGATTIQANSIEIGMIGCEQTTISDSDSHIPTSGAVVDYVDSRLAPIGGLEVIDDDESFPNTIPAAGVVISISDAAGLSVNSSGVSTNGDALDNSTITINGFPSELRGGVGGNADPYVFASGAGLMVVSTGSSHTYNYHQALIREADFVQLSDDISDFNSRYRIGTKTADNHSSNDDGDLFFDTGANKMYVYDGAYNSGGSWKEVTSAGDFKILTVKDHDQAAGGSGPTFNGSNEEFDLFDSSSDASINSAAQLLVVLNGVIQKPNSGTFSGSEEGFYLNDTHGIKFCDPPPSGSVLFVTQIGSAVSLNEPADDSVSAAKIQTGAVSHAKLAADCVDGDNIQDDVINSEHIAAGAIDNEHIADDQIDSEHYAAGSIDLEHMSSQSVDEDNLYIDNAGSNGQFLQKQSGGTGGLLWADASVGGDTGTDYNDNVKVRFGTGNDLEVFHSGSAATIKNTEGNLNITNTGSNTIINADNITFQSGDQGETIARFIDDGVCELWHNNVKTFATTSSGIDVWGPEGGDGNVHIYADEGDDNADCWKLKADTNGGFSIQNYTAGSWENNLTAIGNGAIDLYYDNSKKMSTFSAGIQLENDSALTMNSDSSSIYFGADDDLRIYHNGSDALISNATGAYDISTGGTRRVYIASGGHITFQKDAIDIGTVGQTFTNSGELWLTRDNGIPFSINRKSSDGQLVRYHQDGTHEGNVSVSGSTVSYNGGHLSRWSQFKGISQTDKSARPTIYQGTVLSNLDDLCQWEGETNQQLNMTKVSDTSGDKDVAGVFWTWDDDPDDTVTNENDFYVAMTGDMVIRVAGSTTVARGDLLISAGDGTAKPQADDIIRSSTIAKIISTNSTATYADGSKAYPCVLMAC